MRPTGKTWIVGVISATSVLLLLYLIALHEPRYHGKRLTEWLSELHEENPSPDAIEAVKAIGTNGLPVIRHELRAEDSAIKLKLLQLLAKQQVIKWSHVPAKTRQRRAVMACQILGPGAKPAIPELIKITEEGDTGYSTTALRLIGEDAIPPLLPCLQCTNAIGRAMTAFVLEHFAPKRADIVVPALIKSLNDPHQGVRNGAIRSLRAYKAKSAVPALKQAAERYAEQKDNIQSAIEEIEAQPEHGKP